MLQFFAGLNWTAIILTVLICATANRLTDRMSHLAKVWLEGIRTQRDIEAMRHGYRPKGDAYGGHCNTGKKG